ncbi:uncharacterized protein [Ambystoma mexicanum]|uniref:uncharacterized protein n=1 Tax=Ambystoma mexicanum TaxID=8296 RepID=UPI0037E969BC
MSAYSCYNSLHQLLTRNGSLSRLVLHRFPGAEDGATGSGSHIACAPWWPLRPWGLSKLSHSKSTGTEWLHIRRWPSNAAWNCHFSEKREGGGTTAFVLVRQQHQKVLGQNGFTSEGGHPTLPGTATSVIKEVGGGVEQLLLSWSGNSIRKENSSCYRLLGEPCETKKDCDDGKKEKQSTWHASCCTMNAAKNSSWQKREDNIGLSSSRSYKRVLGQNGFTSEGGHPTLPGIDSSVKKEGGGVEPLLLSWSGNRIRTMEMGFGELSAVEYRKALPNKIGIYRLKWKAPDFSFSTQV